MAFTKITDADRLGKGNVGQPDTPLLTTTEMQEQMDSLPNLAIDAFNKHIDELNASTCARQLGCEVPNYVQNHTSGQVISSVQTVINAIADLIGEASAAKHSHANKAALDTISEGLLENITALTILMANVDAIDVILSDATTAIPTSQAVKNFVEGYNYKNIIKNAIYPIGSVYQTTLVSPDTIFGTTGAWQLLGTDSNGVKTWKRIS